MHISGADCIQYINIFKCMNINLLFYILFLQKSLSILKDTKKDENERDKDGVMFKVYSNWQCDGNYLLVFIMYL